MSEIKIQEITKIKLDRDEKLLVKVPEGTTKEEKNTMRESLQNFFAIQPDRLLIYSGQVEFKVVE